MTIVLTPGRPSPSQVDGHVLVPLRREQIGVLTSHLDCFSHPSEAQRDDLALLDYARRNPELP